MFDATDHARPDEDTPEDYPASRTRSRWWDPSTFRGAVLAAVVSGVVLCTASEIEQRVVQHFTVTLHEQSIEIGWR
ncbi:hypothetical protein [Nocardia fluminea]|uniref:hypothetical protein n=1 Tax=Nocardia fluminea TaxID=134984 RepID=UPI00379D2EB0